MEFTAEQCVSSSIEILEVSKEVINDDVDDSDMFPSS